MQIDWFTFVAQIVNFVILILLLRRFLYGPILSVMDRREKEVISRLEEARLKQVEADEKATSYQRELDELEEKKEEMLRSARQEAEQTKKELLHEARHEIERTRKRWLQSLDTEKEQFIAELQRRTSGRIIGIVRKLVSDLAGRNLEKQAIDTFLEQLEQLDQEEGERALRTANADEKGKGTLKVTSSFPLEKKEQDRIRKRLGEVLSTPFTCSFSTSEQLLFGIEIRTSGWKMGWNAQDYLDELRDNLEKIFEEETDVMIHEQPLPEEERRGDG